VIFSVNKRGVAVALFFYWPDLTEYYSDPRTLIIAVFQRISVTFTIFCIYSFRLTGSEFRGTGLAGVPKNRFEVGE
jgi:hypothetical protein